MGWCCGSTGQGADPLLDEHRHRGKVRNPHAGNAAPTVRAQQQRTTSSPPLQSDQSTRWKITLKADKTVICRRFVNMCLPSMFENKAKQNKTLRKPGNAELQLGFSHASPKQTAHLCSLRLPRLLSCEVNFSSPAMKWISLQFFTMGIFLKENQVGQKE